MPYLTLTLTENLKATTKPWFSRLLRHPARKRSGSILGQTHTRLLTYLLAPDPNGALDATPSKWMPPPEKCSWSRYDLHLWGFDLWSWDR